MRKVIVVARAVKDIHHLYDIKVAQRIKALWKAVAVVLHIAIDLKPARKLVKTVGFYVVAAKFGIHGARREKADVPRHTP